MRVIAGKFRNRILKTEAGYRPTSDRVREALFNILQNQIEGTVFVDAFAGSGAVGIEAISRGAGLVYFLESNRKALRILKANLDECCRGENWRVYAMDVPRGLEVIQKEHPAVDILFFDPPYDYQHYPGLLSQSLALFPEAEHILETSARTTFVVPPGVTLLKHRKIGETLLSIYCGAE